MSVYFVHRSYYEGPAVKRLRTFPESTLLEWFQNHWQGASEEEQFARVEELFGFDVYGFGQLFLKIAEEGVEMPRSNQDLTAALEAHLVIRSDFRFKPHVVQVCTDDDETDIAYYLFDDLYLEKNRPKAAFLLHEDWRLPVEAEGQGGFKLVERPRKLGSFGKGPGQTYLAFVAHDLEDLRDLSGALLLDGVRLPELIPALIEAVPDKRWPDELLLLRLLASSRDLSLGEVLGRVARAGGLNLLEFEVLSGKAAAGKFEELQREVIQELEPDMGKPLIHVGEHVAQLINYMDDWDDDGIMYQRWSLFDDVWAAQHEDLANGILRFVARWDVLT